MRFNVCYNNYKLLYLYIESYSVERRWIIIKTIFIMRYMRLICHKLKSNVLQNRQVTIVTIHNYSKVYEVEGNVSFQHVGGDW